ncbi:MAG: type I DNA topoisomerase [Candidatus Paceibacterota bacterium]
MKLLVVESPAKAKTISKYLNDEYTVKSSVGHIRDIPKSNKNAIDIEGGFIPNYQIVPDKMEVVHELKELAEKASEVVLATDPDREGEAIAWHLKEALCLKNPKRIVFNEITKQAVQEAIKHPRKIDDNLRRAQEARRVLDRLFGYDLSGLIWKKVRYGLSAGRVQSPALRILMEREREIQAFIPQDYWVITALTKTHEGVEFPLTCSEEPKEEDDAEKIVQKGRESAWHISEIKETNAVRKARAPFITSTLQQSASTRLGFAPSKTMMLAQRLYEAGYISYMRTDSTSLSSEAQGAIIALVQKEHGKEYVDAKTHKTRSKGAQEAHEAIRPTDVTKKEAGANHDQKRLYKLIWQRAVASQMSDAKIVRTKIIAEASESAVPSFYINGSRTSFLGWLAVDKEAGREETELPKVHEGEKLTLSSLESEHKQTEPPHRYTEAGLIKELEKRGIGRPSTYASIIKTILDRNYVEKEGKTLFPTDLGEVVSSFLEQNFKNYISDSFTAEMEDELDEIASGKREYTKTLEDFYGPFTKALASKSTIPKLTNLGAAPKEFLCPQCGSDMNYKLGKGGKFLSCSRYPECEGALTIEGKEVEPPKETGEQCPLCNSNLIEREGRFGKFVGCSNYPKCKYLTSSAEEIEKNKTDIPCPECAQGMMSARRGRFGEFYSCSEYPQCKYAIKARPTGAKCPLCEKLMMEGTKTIPERCSDKTCSNHNPHKSESKKK